MSGSMSKKPACAQTVAAPAGSSESAHVMRELSAMRALLESVAERQQIMAERQGSTVAPAQTGATVDARMQTELAMAHLAAIVDSSDDAIISKDLNGIITTWNDAAERMFGYSANEVVGKSVTLLMPIDRVHEEPGILERVGRGEAIRHYETVRRHKDGTLLDVSLTVSPIKNAEGRIIGASKIARDITAEKQAARAGSESISRFRALFESSPFAVYSCDMSGKIQEFNERAAELWGQSPDADARYCGSYKAYRNDGTVLPCAQSPMARLIKGEIPIVHEHEIQIERPDGARVMVLMNIVPFANERGEMTGAINCFYDVTERRQFEEALERYATELAEIDRHKNEFLAMLGHELRNPMAPIRNAIQILQVASADARARRAALHTLDRQAVLLARLVDDLLDAGRLANGKIELKRAQIDLRGVMQTVAEDFRGAHEPFERTFELTLTKRPIYANADIARIIQVVSNLLGNAYKCTDSGGRIALILERSGGRALIRVRDDGLGIAPDQISRIFSLFGQASNAPPRAAGLGIGLALALTLVNLHGGTLEAYSRGLGQGSEFVVSLPSIPASGTQVPTRAPQPLSGHRILVVDDNRDAAESLATLLELNGNATRIAYDGLQAIEEAVAFHPDTVLMDIGLPRLDGYEAARRMRNRPWGRDIVLIAISGWGQEDDRKKAHAAGFDGHMVKPLDFAALTRMMETATAARRKAPTASKPQRRK